MVNSGQGLPDHAAARPSSRMVRIGFLTLSLYVIAIDVYYFFMAPHQDSTGMFRGRVIFFLVFFLLLALVLAAAALAQRELSIQLAIASISGLFCCGVLAILSIGIAFLLAALCGLALLIGRAVTTPSSVRLSTRGRFGRVLAGVLPVVVLAIGLVLT
jgi:hypothetical protein